MMGKNILEFIFELGHLRIIKHEGWKLLGIDSPESVAEHSLRAAQIGYILALLEKFKNPDSVVTALVFHDIGETRIGDLTLISKKYLKANEEKAVTDQLENLKFLKKHIMRYWLQVENKTTKLGIIAKDADLLEQAITAKELTEKGYNNAIKWIDNVEVVLKTRSAKSLLKDLKTSDSSTWWQKLNSH